MSKYRKNLPQLNGRMFITDGGLETTLIFHHGMDLPHFASFPMIANPIEYQLLEEYFISYLGIAKKNKMGFVLETPTFRSNKDWGYKLGYDLEGLDEINKSSIIQFETLRTKFESVETPIVISGCIGPRGDGYVVSDIMNIDEAKDYHSLQIKSFCEAGTDMITSYTMNYINEALGIVLAAKELNVPASIGFTVETDGSLPSSETLKEAIEIIDQETDKYPAYYMINCAHPSHFIGKLQTEEAWIKRIMAIRANASTKSHSELDECTHLDAGNKNDLLEGYKLLNALLPNLKVIGGCCGTDHSHIEEISKYWIDNVS